jgi:RNA polymerase sigma-70 factor (ECF subfamily)
MVETGDSELVRLIRLSDYAAFEELHRRFWPGLQQQAYRKMGDRQDAYDLLQEMFVELWEKREELRFGEELKGWLQKRLWFKLATWFRTRGFQAKHLEDFRKYTENIQSGTRFDPVEMRQIDAYYDELLAAINKAVEEMPERMREVFLLNRREQYSVSEIAARLELSPKTVRNQLERAVVRIRKSTEGYYPAPMELIFLFWVLYS